MRATWCHSNVPKSFENQNQNIHEYDLQKGAIHKALDITVPPPTNAAVAAPAPKVAAPVSHKKVRCSSDKKAPSLTQHWKDCLAGECRCCEENRSTSNDSKASHWREALIGNRLSFKTDNYLQDSQACMLKMREVEGKKNNRWYLDQAGVDSLVPHPQGYYHMFE